MSGAIDQIAAGSMVGEREFAKDATETPKRLVLVAAGNVVGGLANVVDEGGPITDPAQAWNALTVGGYTTKIELTDEDLAPLRGANEVSPYSTCTRGLPTDLLPIKPEVMFEAGNMAVDPLGFCDWHPALSLLAASNAVDTEPLVPFWATSAAVGVAGHFVGQLQAALPGLWPETYRALVVQSARWPEPIRRRLIGRGKSWKTGSKALADRRAVLRQAGFGVPQLHAAIASAKNDFTMIAQAEIQPYAAGANGGSPVYNAIHFYDLPWPKTVLADLNDKAVTLRVTLSYFIEPNLTGKGATRPETYRSFGLRFTLKKRDETEEHFRSRLSQIEADGEQEDEMLDEDEDEDFQGVADDGEAEDKKKTQTSKWLIGPGAVSAGSLHCDIWRGKASDLIDHDAIAVHPAPGWWKSHGGKRRFGDSGRYGLVLSISADGSEVDLYAEAANVLTTKAALIDLETLIG
ncbi:S8 family serine peptidase [Phenylobacterium sp. J367]|uniref:S8 family serine peptidase n=1 Tax=Phenylobacterium sp. J367 TaxID=2898435 RepID=UPI002151DE2C|nr:S8 family serine peptidase [Phenylobacterium sp. J367]MCR5879877.1 S8 family serine peptidase [Phenylobacterium sp. J367]